MDKFQRDNSFNTNTPSSESYKKEFNGHWIVQRMGAEKNAYVNTVTNTS
jgi:hypothetical protein